MSWDKHLNATKKNSNPYKMEICEYSVLCHVIDMYYVFYNQVIYHSSMWVQYYIYGLVPLSNNITLYK